MAEMIMGTEIRDPSLESLSNLGEELEKESLAPYAEKLGITEELEEKQQRLYAEIENPYESCERILIEGLEEKREGVYGEISIPLLKTTIEKKNDVYTFHIETNICRSAKVEFGEVRGFVAPDI